MQANDSKIKYFIYARKSTESEDRQVLSIPSQIDEMKDTAKRLKLDIVDVLSESKSAKSPGREIFNKMMADVKQGKAQGILCWKLDRLARNPVDGGEVAWLLQQGVIKHIKTPERDYFPEDNVLLMNVEFGMANQFILDLRKNTKRGLTAKAKQGWCPCASKPGYMGDRLGDKGEKKVLTDSERFPLLKKAFGLVLSGSYSVSQILDKLNNEWGYRTPVKKRIGGKPMASSSFYRVLIDPFYYGRFQYDGNWYDGKHEKMITESDYWNVQEFLGRKGKPRPKKHKFAFTGLLRCGECNAMVTAEHKIKHNKTNDKVRHYTYYRCTKNKKDHPNCGQKTVEVNDLEKQVDDYLKIIQIPEDFKNWAVKWLNKLNDEEVDSRTAIYHSQQKTYNDIQKQIDNLTQMRLRNLLNDEEYLAQKNRLLKQRSQLAEKLRDTEHRTDNWQEQAEKTFDFSCNARYWFKNGDLDAKKAILSALGSNFILEDRKLSINLQKPFEIIQNGFADIRRLEPATIGLSDKKNTSPTKGDVFWGG